MVSQGQELLEVSLQRNRCILNQFSYDTDLTCNINSSLQSVFQFNSACKVNMAWLSTNLGTEYVKEVGKYSARCFFTGVILKQVLT